MSFEKVRLRTFSKGCWLVGLVSISDRGSSHFLAEIASLSLLLTLICNRLKNANIVRLHQQFNTKILLDGS